MATSVYPDLYNAILNLMTTPVNDPAALQVKAQELATAIDDHFKNGMLTVTSSAPAVVAPGIPVATAGGPTNQVGATTGPGQASISAGGLQAN